MTQRQIEVRSFIHRIPLEIVQRFDSSAKRIQRHVKKGQLGFDESLFDHTARLIDRAQHIADTSSHIGHQIDMQSVGGMLYFHEAGKLGIQERDAHHVLRREVRKEREKRYFEETVIPTLPAVLRPEAQSYYTRYNEGKPDDKEALFAHFIDKADIAIITVRHFQNPIAFDTGHDPSVHIKNIQQVLKPVSHLLRLLPLEGQVELLQQVIEIKNEFLQAGYELNRQVMNSFDTFIKNAFIRE